MISDRSEQVERSQPVPRNSKCKAIHTFQGESPQDLSFSVGEELIILEPTSVMFWYVARNARGDEGIIPITFVELDRQQMPAVPPLPPKPGSLSPPGPLSGSPLMLARRASNDTKGSNNDYTYLQDELPPPPPPPPLKPKSKTLPRPTITPHPPIKQADSIDSRPPMPLPSPTFFKQRGGIVTNSKLNLTNVPTSPPAPIISGSYPTIQSFFSESGWFQPTVDMVLSKKLSISLHVFRRMHCAIYYFQHKYDPSKHYVGKSLELYDDLTRLFSRLYEKPVDQLNSLEKELRFNSSKSEQWNVRAWTHSKEELDYEFCKLIVQRKSLQPSGLNEELKFISRKDFTKFCEWYTEQRHKAV